DDPGVRVFGIGMARMITDKLILMEKYEQDFWVVSNRIVREKNVHTASDARKILGSNLVISGNLRRNQNRIWFYFNLENPKTGKKIQSEKYQAHITNLSLWQDEVVMKLIDFLKIDLNSEKQRLLRAGGTSFPGAHDFYIQSLGYLARNRDPGSIDKAFILLDQAIEQDAFYAAAFVARGEACFYKYKLTKDRQWLVRAESCFQKALQLNQDSGSALLMLGKVYREQGRYAKSLDQFQKAIYMNPRYYTAYLEAAFTHEDSKSLFKAEEYYKKLIKIRPDYWQGYDFLAYFYYDTGRLNEAEKMYLKAHELNRYNIKAYNNLIGIYNKKGDNEKAWTMFEKAIELKPNSTAYSNIGNNLFFQGKYEAAKNMYEKAIELGKSDRRIWGNLADSYRYLRTHKNRSRQVYQKAIELARNELKLDPVNASVRSSLALYLSKMGKSNQAIDEIGLALLRNPNDLNVIYNSIVVYELSKQRNKSMLALKAYLRRHGSLAQLDKDPDLDLLRKDIRYRRVLEQKAYFPVSSRKENK
ncbi:MAG: tetratricopeptide repeat protein, partial [Candidatus Aminicenantes bacterium]|nr:tetratricopeptide repeat protein [Candidatus Aminicenantes bacterium]